MVCFASMSNAIPAARDDQAEPLVAADRLRQPLNGTFTLIYSAFNDANRGALIVRPKQPYLAWAAGLDDSGIVPDVEGEKTVYLVSEFEDDEAWAIIEQVYTEVFKRELYGWHTDESAWPKNRTFALFLEWFDVEFHSVVEDLAEDDIADDGG